MAVSKWLRKEHVGADRRGDFRTICTGESVIDVLSPRPQPAVQARILDVGTSSLKLGVPSFISPGSLLRIHLTESVAEAEVRHCTCEASGYHVGVNILEIISRDQQSVGTLPGHEPDAAF